MTPLFKGEAKVKALSVDELRSRSTSLREAVDAVLEDQTDLLATVAPAEWARTSGWRGPRLQSLRMVRGAQS